MKYFSKHLIFFIAIICLHQQLSAQSGELDSTFGENGIAIHDYHTFNSASLMQQDGKVVIARTKSVLWRINPDGSADETFGLKGLYTYKNSGSGEYPKIGRNFGLAFHQNGKILMLCDLKISSNESQIAIIRVNTNGITDSSFGTNGISIINKNIFENPTGIAVKNDGKIIVSGQVSDPQNNQNRTFLLCLNVNGELDKTFGDMGYVITKNPIGAFNEEIQSRPKLLVCPNGNIISATKNKINSDDPIVMLAGYTKNGSTDNSFGSMGLAEYTFPEGKNALINAIALQPDGKIICTGSISVKENKSMALCRFNTDGSIDKSFGTNGGIIITALNASENLDIILQPDGKILTVGVVEEQPGLMITLLSRFTTNGEPDPAFGENGTTTLNFDSLYGDAGQTVYFLPDMKILVTGTSGEGNIFLARFK